MAITEAASSCRRRYPAKPGMDEFAGENADCPFLPTSERTEEKKTKKSRVFSWKSRFGRFLDVTQTTSLMWKDLTRSVSDSCGRFLTVVDWRLLSTEASRGKSKEKTP